MNLEQRQGEGLIHDHSQWSGSHWSFLRPGSVPMSLKHNLFFHAFCRGLLLAVKAFYKQHLMMKHIHTVYSHEAAWAEVRRATESSLPPTPVQKFVIRPSGSIGYHLKKNSFLRLAPRITGWNNFSGPPNRYLAWNCCLSQNHQFPLNELESNAVLILSPIISGEMNGAEWILA